jgi:hypothetical protein
VLYAHTGIAQRAGEPIQRSLAFGLGPAEQACVALGK